MEFKHIEYFIKASKYTSMSKAAENLFISQQALSKCMQTLENEVGCRLFHRTAKGSSLTDEGRKLYDKFAPIVEQFHIAELEVYAELSDRPKKITVASSPLIFGVLAPNILYSFKEKYPNCELEVIESADTEVEQYVADDPSHLGLIVEPEHWHGEKFDFIKVHTYQLGICVHKDDPLAERETVRFEELRDYPFVAVDKRSYYQEIIKQKGKECGFEPKIIFESADVNQLCSLVNQGKGIFMAVPIYAHTALFKNIRTLLLEDTDMTYSIAFVCRNFEKLSVHEKRFIEYVREWE